MFSNDFNVFISEIQGLDLICFLYVFNFFIYFNRSYRDQTGKMLGLWEAIRPLITPLIFFALSTIWVYLSPTNIIERDPRMFLFMVGTIFANVNVSSINLF